MNKKTTPYKQPIAVNCHYPADAPMYPVSFIWHDGDIYDIKKILQSFSGAICRHGIIGPVYKCQVGRSIVYIGMDNQTQKWYLEYDHERNAPTVAN